MGRGHGCGQDLGQWAEPDPLSPAGFEGTVCERNVDDCSPDPCHHGRCVDGIASFSCACAPGYTGMRCESQVDECRSQPCRHGGKCLDLVDKYLCRCPPGTTGRARSWAGTGIVHLMGQTHRGRPQTTSTRLYAGGELQGSPVGQALSTVNKKLGAEGTTF